MTTRDTRARARRNRGGAYCDTESNRYIGALMLSRAPRRSIIATLRGSSRLAALMLALFLTSIVSTVACADHDLADAGIGQHQAHMPSLADTDPPTTGGGVSSGHSAGHCCHSGGHHAPAMSSLVALAPVVATDDLASITDPAYLSALGQRELRPPIL